MSAVEIEQRQYEIHPLSGDSLRVNNQIIGHIRNMTALVAGIGAGIFGLESYQGFGFYFLCWALTSILVYIVLTDGRPKNYFQSVSDIFTAEGFSGIMSFAMTWTLVYELVNTYK